MDVLQVECTVPSKEGVHRCKVTIADDETVLSMQRKVLFRRGEEGTLAPYGAVTAMVLAETETDLMLLDPSTPFKDLISADPHLAVTMTAMPAWKHTTALFKGHQFSQPDVTISPCGTHLIATGAAPLETEGVAPPTLLCHNLATGHSTTTAAVHRVQCVALSASHLAFSEHYSPEVRLLRFPEDAGSAEAAEVAFTLPSEVLALSAVGTRVVGGCVSGVVVFDLTKKVVENRFAISGRGLAVSPCGRYACGHEPGGSNARALISLSNGKVLDLYPFQSRTFCTFSPCGSRILFCGPASIAVYRTSGDTPRLLAELKVSAPSAFFSCCLNYVILQGALKGTVERWSMDGSIVQRSCLGADVVQRLVVAGDERSVAVVGSEVSYVCALVGLGEGEGDVSDSPLSAGKHATENTSDEARTECEVEEEGGGGGGGDREAVRCGGGCVCQ